MDDSPPDHDAMVREMRAPWLWTNATTILLGLWLISSPVTFGYHSTAMTWSDIASGASLHTVGSSEKRELTRIIK
jgi:hypothetical protein